MGMVLTFYVWQLIQVLALVVLGWAAWKVYARFDERRENRRKKSAKLAFRCASRGANRFAALFSDYSVGNYSGLVGGIHKMAENIEDGIDVLSMEFEAIAKSMITEMATTPEGRASLEKTLSGATTTASA